MVTKRKKSTKVKKSIGKKTSNPGQQLKSRRNKSRVKKGKRQVGTLKRRLRGLTRGKRNRGPFNTGYDQGYREGHAKGFEDAHQESYMNNAGIVQPQVQLENVTVTDQIPIQIPSEANYIEANIPSVPETRIGILYICIGKYNVFWESFYRSAEALFLPGYKKNYYVFTDSGYIVDEDKANITKIYQVNSGWPVNTLLRYAMFKNIIQQLLQECDYIYYFDANMQFADVVGEEILPIYEGLVAVQHPSFYDKTPGELAFDRNPQSLAYIPEGTGNNYFMGAMVGGRTEHFTNLIRVLDENIYADMINGVNAIRYDESHLNKYLVDKFPKVMNPSYGYLEGSFLPFPKKILIRDKNNFGGLSYLRS